MRRTIFYFKAFQRKSAEFECSIVGARGNDQIHRRATQSQIPLVLHIFEWWQALKITLLDLDIAPIFDDLRLEIFHIVDRGAIHENSSAPGDNVSLPAPNESDKRVSSDPGSATVMESLISGPALG